MKKLIKMKKIILYKPSISSFAEPIIYLNGESGLWVTFDFQMINKIVGNYAYPLHRIDDQIESMCSFAWFSTLDLTKGYHQKNWILFLKNIRHLQHPWDFFNGRSCLWVWILLVLSFKIWQIQFWKIYSQRSP